MEQNNGNYQNGGGNPPDLNKTPDNPYTQYYHEYIVTPGEVKNEVSKSKRVGSIVLCALSDMVMLSLTVYWIVLAYQAVNGYAGVIDTGSFLAVTLLLFVYFMPGALVPSIIAKALNRKNKWALINLICLGVILVTILVLSFILPAWA